MDKALEFAKERAAQAMNSYREYQCSHLLDLEKWIKDELALAFRAGEAYGVASVGRRIEDSANP